MGYQIVTVRLADGRAFEGVTVAEGVITEVPGYSQIPFSESEISDLVVTHAKTQR